MEFIDNRDLPDNFTLRLTSDWQLGSVTSAKHRIDEVLAPVRLNENYRIGFVGDIFDWIGAKDKRFSFSDVDPELPTALAALYYGMEKIETVADKTVFFGAGNHEQVADREIGDLTRFVCKRTDVPYGGYSAIIRINETTQILAWHGRRSINSTLADPFQRNIAIKRALVRTNMDRWGRQDVAGIFQGHTNHLVAVSPEESLMAQTYYDWDKRSIESNLGPMDPKWYVCCGSLQKAFVEGHTTYVEAAGYFPLPLGCVDVIFKDSRIADVKIVRLA